jgi:hypothetical protein
MPATTAVLARYHRKTQANRQLFLALGDETAVVLADGRTVSQRSQDDDSPDNGHRYLNSPKPCRSSRPLKSSTGSRPKNHVSFREENLLWCGVTPPAWPHHLPRSDSPSPAASVDDLPATHLPSSQNIYLINRTVEPGNARPAVLSHFSCLPLIASALRTAPPSRQASFL